MLRWSAASTWICCCTWATPARCSVDLACAWRSASSRSGSCCACSSTCAASSIGLFLGFHALRGQVLDLGGRLVLARGPLRGLFLQLHQPLLDALAALDHEADLGLQPADLGAGLVQLALRLVDLVAGRVVGLADGLELALDAAQVGHARFEVVHRLLGVGLDLGLVGLALGALQEPQLVLLERDVGLQRVVLLRDLGLLLQLVQVGVELAQDVLDPRQVLARVREAVLGLAPALLVLGDARGFLQEQAQLLGLGFDDPADRALADDGVGARAQAGAQEHVLHVAPAHRLVVDVVAGGAVARQHALDGDLGELAPTGRRRGGRRCRTPVRPTSARPACGVVVPLKITSCMDSPRSSLACDSPSTQRTASMMLDLPQPLGPTTPTSWPGNMKLVGSAKDLNPDNLMELRRTQIACGLNCPPRPCRTNARCYPSHSAAIPPKRRA